MPSPSHVLSFRAFLSVILATVRESSEVKEGVLWIPHRVGNDNTPPNEEGTSNDRGKRKTALIGPRGRQPRAGKRRGLCERSEFRSPRARRRRPSEKARYRAAVLLGSFFSPKRRMNKKSLHGFPIKWGMTVPPSSEKGEEGKRQSLPIREKEPPSWIPRRAGNDNTLKFCEMPGARLLEATYAGIWGARLRRTARHTSA